MSSDRPLRLPDPMLATLGPPPSGDGWAVEYKWDGFRGRCIIESFAVKVFSRNTADITSLGVGVLRMVENPTSRR